LRGDDAGAHGGAADVVEGKTGAMRRGASIGNGVQMAGGDAWLEDEFAVGFGDAASIVEDGERTVAARVETGRDVDVARSSVSGVADQFQKGILDRVDVRGTAA